MLDGRRELLRALDAWRRGVADAPVVCKWTAGGPATAAPASAQSQSRSQSQSPALPQSRSQSHPQSLSPADGGVGNDAGKGYLVVASTGDIDRHGDTVAPDGWRLDAYRANPVVLWAHDYRQPAIGRAAAVWRQGGSLLASIEFAPTEFGGTVAALYQQGYQRGVSVGFRPIRFEERRDGRSGAFLGIRFLEQELLEISAVPVPANGAALLRAGDDYAHHPQISARDTPPVGMAPGDTAASVVMLLRGLRG